MTVIGYTRVSTREQQRTGYGLGAQHTAIEREAAYRGWTDLIMIEDGAATGANLNRPGLQHALELLGDGDTLVVAKLDRLSRSMMDFAKLLALARHDGWSVVALDLGVDTTTPGGELVANVLVSVAQWERRIIADRTREGLAVAKARGAKLGRPSTLPPATAALIVGYRRDGMTQAATAARLNGDGVSTASGRGQWIPQLVQRVEKREATTAAATAAA